MQQQELKYWLSHPKEVNPEQVILLQQLAATYPAFTALQVCLWRIYKHNKHLLLDAQQRKVVALAPEELFLWDDLAAISDPLPMENEHASISNVVHEIAINQDSEVEKIIQSEQELAINQSVEEYASSEVENVIEPEPELTIDHPIAESASSEVENVIEAEPELEIFEEITKSASNTIEAEIQLEPGLTIVHEVAIEQIGEEEEPDQVGTNQAENQENTNFRSLEAEEQIESGVEVKLEEFQTHHPDNDIASVEHDVTSEEAPITEKDQITLLEEPIGSNPEMTFAQWLSWIQERRTQVIDQSSEADANIQEAVTAPEQAINANDPLEKLYQEHMNAEYLKLDETAGPSLQKEALDRVKKAESGEKNSFNLQQIAKDSLDENLIPVSETLAKIYESQEEWKRALAVYEKLLLQFPDKTLLFAAKIQELKTKI